MSYTGRASARMGLQEMEGAVADLSKAVQLSPGETRPLVQRGYVYAGMGKKAEALADFEEVLKQDPKDETALIGRAEIRRAERKFEEALADYSKVLKEQPGMIEALLGRASVYYVGGQIEKALADYGTLTKRHTGFAQGWNDYAWLLSTGPADGLRDGKKAVELATRACELTEWANGAYLDTLAASYAEAGNFEVAVKMQRRAVEFSDKESQETQEEIKSRVALYLDKKAYRETPPQKDAPAAKKP